MFGSERLLFSYPPDAESGRLAEWLCELENVRLMSPLLPYPQSPRQVLDRLRAGHAAPFTGAPGAYELSIYMRDRAEPVGIAGLYSIDQGHSVAEIGVSLLDPELQGRGLGFEAHQRWVQYAFEDLGFQKLTGTVKSSNTRALALAKKLGMQTEGILRSHRYVSGVRVDLVLLGLLREEWRMHPTAPDQGNG
ncbi:MAG: GNAT family protein [Solirubrobacterales bacterium]